MPRSLNAVFLLAVVVLGILLGWLAADQPLGIPFAILFAFTIIAASFINLDLAIGILLLSMLLSPEIPVAQVPHRAVVIRFDDLILILIFVIWLARTAIDRKLPLIHSSPVNKYIYYYLAVCFISTGKGILVGDVRFFHAMFYLLKYTEYFILFWMVFNVIQKKRDINIFMIFAALTAVAVIIYGYSRFNTLVVAPFDFEPASMGGYLLIVLAVCIGTAIYNPHKWIKYGSILAAVLILPLLVKTQSRASYLAFIPMFITITVLTEKYRKSFIATGIIILMLIIHIFYSNYRRPLVSETGFSPAKIYEDIYATLKDRVEYTFSGNYSRFNLEPSAAARVITWQEMLAVDWPKKPLLGWGIMGKGFIDSQYVRTLTELGIAGFVLFMLLIYKLFAEAKKIYRQTDKKWAKGVALGFIASFVGLLFQAFTTNTFIIVRVMEPFWFLAAVVMAVPNLRSVEYGKAGQ